MESPDQKHMMKIPSNKTVLICARTYSTESPASICADKFCMMNSWFFAVWVWVPRLVRLRAFHHLWLFVIVPLWLSCLCPLSLPHCDIFFLTTWSVQITISSLCLHKYFGIFFPFLFSFVSKARVFRP